MYSPLYNNVGGLFCWKKRKYRYSKRTALCILHCTIMLKVYFAERRGSIDREVEIIPQKPAKLEFFTYPIIKYSNDGLRFLFILLWRIMAILKLVFASKHLISSYTRTIDKTFWTVRELEVIQGLTIVSTRHLIFKHGLKWTFKSLSMSFHQGKINPLGWLDIG